MNETQLRAKIASADAVMRGVIRSAGEDSDKWSKSDEKTFDKAVADQKAARAELQKLAGTADREAQLQTKIRELRANRYPSSSESK